MTDFGVTRPTDEEMQAALAHHGLLEVSEPTPLAEALKESLERIDRRIAERERQNPRD